MPAGAHTAQIPAPPVPAPFHHLAQAGWQALAAVLLWATCDSAALGGGARERCCGHPSLVAPPAQAPLARLAPPAAPTAPQLPSARRAPTSCQLEAAHRRALLAHQHCQGVQAGFVVVTQRVVPGRLPGLQRKVAAQQV